MKLTYVLDTNVILYSPGAIFSFADNDVVIPEVVLEELDSFKKNNNDLGANARHAARIIDKLRKDGSLIDGIVLPGGGTLRVEMNHYDVKLPPSWDKNKPDNRIIQVCKGLKEKGEEVVLITKDTFERIKADTINIDVEDFYEKVVPEYESQYKGRCDAFASHSTLESFYKNKYMDVESLFFYSEEKNDYYKADININEFILIKSMGNPKQTALGRYNGEKVVPLFYKDVKPLGISPRNIGQKFMLEAFLTDSKNAPLVIVKGPAGTAKTLFSLATGLHKVMEEGEDGYRKILICRPNVTMDEDIGFYLEQRKKK